MNTQVTIVMYHYVRDLASSRYPRLKGLDVSLFKEQLEYLQKHYNIIKMQLLINAVEEKTKLPPKAALLTFDDAYIDHYSYVFSLLCEKKLQGAFFIPTKAVRENTVLDVNKIHFILASQEDETPIINEIFKELDNYRSEYKLESNDYYFRKLALPNRMDSKETIFIKRLLQVALPEKLRHIILGHLFERFIGMDEKDFSRKLYMNLKQIENMQREGMYIGSHGNDHCWLGSLSREKQESEIEKSLQFIKEIGGDLSNWTMSYPFGNYNDDTIEILENKNCKIALTSEVGIADLSKHHKLKLPRLDTNDLPKNKNAPVNEWLDKVIS